MTRARIGWRRLKASGWLVAAGIAWTLAAAGWLLLVAVLLVW